MLVNTLKPLNTWTHGENINSNVVSKFVESSRLNGIVLLSAARFVLDYRETNYLGPRYVSSIERSIILCPYTEKTRCVDHPN